MGSRKYFLDWLRVIAFGLLIVFHVGCLYATWTYNIKSSRIFPQADWALLALQPWRMALLFLISGVASRYLVARLGAGGFALDRLRRLVPVILFGMFVVIPPQMYILLLDRGVMHQDYGHFWLFSYLRFDQTLVAPLHRTIPTYDHLWFLVYLLVYALVFAATAFLFSGFRNRPVKPMPLWLLTGLPASWLVVTIFVMERVAPATFWIGNDWGSHLKWAGLFLIGAGLAVQDGFWDWTQRRRGWLAGLAVICLILQSANRALYLTGHDDPLWSAIRWSVASGLFAWFTICALFGYAGRYLDRPSTALTHLNQAILPVYVLHQPVLLMTAYYLFPLHLPVAGEVAILIAVTAIGSLAIYELLIRPFGVMRFLFGLKAKTVKDTV